MMMSNSIETAPSAGISTTEAKFMCKSIQSQYFFV